MRYFYLTVILLSMLMYIASCGDSNKKNLKNTVTMETNKLKQTNDSVLKIVAVMTLKDAVYKDEVEKAFKAVVDGSNTEEGCIYYELHQNVSKPEVYVMIEVWKSQSAIDYHNQTSHFKIFKSAINNKLDIVSNVIREVYP